MNSKRSDDPIIENADKLTTPEGPHTTKELQNFAYAGVIIKLDAAKTSRQVVRLLRAAKMSHMNDI